MQPDDLPRPNYIPAAQNQFGTLARIAGIYAQQEPLAGEDWRLSIIWYPLQSEDQAYRFSAQLVDNRTGQTYGAVDGSALEARACGIPTIQC